MKLWKGRFQKEADPKTNDFNSSISIDSRMYREDIEGSMAHATMLGECGIIEKGESEKIVKGLQGILADLDSGATPLWRGSSPPASATPASACTPPAAATTRWPWMCA